MADLTLTSQSIASSAIKSRTDDLKTLMDARLDVWRRIPDAKKLAWVKSGKDPVMTLAWNVYKYLRDNFFGEGELKNG